MRKGLILVLAFNAGLLAVRVAQETGVVEAGAERTTSLPGDANGDLFLDITDPVYLLQHLFLGGPPPAAHAGGGTGLGERVTALEELLAGVSRVQLDDGQGGTAETIRFDGVNLQVTNGTGRTGQEPNGTGNLIVGYNRTPVDRPADRTGSHNIVCGDQNNYTSWGSLITGTRNISAARFANVLGGKEKVADEEWERVGAAHDDAEDFLTHVSVVQIPVGGERGGEDGECVVPVDYQRVKTARLTGINLQLVSGIKSTDILDPEKTRALCRFSGDVTELESKDDSPDFLGDPVPDRNDVAEHGNTGLGNLFLGYVEYVGERVNNEDGYWQYGGAAALGAVRLGEHNLIMGEGACWPYNGNIVQGGGGTKQTLHGSTLTGGIRMNGGINAGGSIRCQDSITVSGDYQPEGYPVFVGTQLRLVFDPQGQYDGESDGFRFDMGLGSPVLWSLPVDDETLNDI